MRPSLPLYNGSRLRRSRKQSNGPIWSDIAAALVLMSIAATMHLVRD